MQSAEVISLNFWQILISLCNLLLIFLIIKKFLFKPVKNVLKKRQETIEKDYSDAKKAKEEAENEKALYDSKIKSAYSEAEKILNKASGDASVHGEKIINEAKEKADGIIRRAKADADLEYKRAQEGIKSEIVEVSAQLAQKLIKREINEEDHRNIIDSFIESIGENNE